MKKYVLSLLLGGAADGAARATAFDFSRLRYEKAPGHATKAQLRQLLGTPARVTQPRYECGPLAGSAFYSLHYGPAVYTGRAGRDYLLDEVKFKPGSPPLRYGAHRLSAATTVADLRRLFGADAQVTTQPAGAQLVWVAARGGEEAGMFLFRNGHLTEYSYWAAC